MEYRTKNFSEKIKLIQLLKTSDSNRNRVEENSKKGYDQILLMFFKQIIQN